MKKYRTLLSVLLSLAIALTGATASQETHAAQRQTSKQAASKTKKATASKKAVVKKNTTKKAVAKKVSKQTIKRRPAVSRLPRVNIPQVVQVQTDHTGGLILPGVSAYAVASQRTGQIVAGNRIDSVMPIASITKLMTAMVTLDGKQPLDEILTIEDDDVDRLKGSSSRLPVGTRLSRADMLHLALMSSENRAASALARYYPGGRRAFVNAMNIKARLIGLTDTHFLDSTGLNPGNVSSPRDLVKMVRAGAGYDVIRNFSTDTERYMRVGSRLLHYRNTNSIVREGEWPVDLSKTGYIREAGHCVVMQARIRSEPVIIVLMDAGSTGTRTVEARKVKHWLETDDGQQRLYASAYPATAASR